MEASTISLFLTLSLIAATAAGQNSTETQGFLDAHNLARAEVGVQPLVWNDTVADYAVSYANNCTLEKSGGPYGENLATGEGQFTGEDAVSIWVSEGQNYSSSSNTCNGVSCEQYTQVVWRDSTQLGCALLECSNLIFAICCYYPPGNIAGQTPF
ncbi:pathogenesis-related protein 1C-like [Salvia hispanica]|uniref:pathogenesis-related protein 1C-like n=1 Tax=Salvia hispanica TaxID=49212 RepID=UPI0020095416|nr:pathogenesis-related protein 1C-like [Salvia hispanica]